MVRLSVAISFIRAGMDSAIEKTYGTKFLRALKQFLDEKGQLPHGTEPKTVA